MDFKNKIFNEDCFITMKKMSESDFKVNLILTSPPYNTAIDLKSERARNNHEGRYDEYSECMSNDEYDNFISRLFIYYDKVLSKNGVVLFNISYGNENPTQMWTCISKVCEETSFIISDCIVWKKSSAIPNNRSCNKTTRICEFVFVLCRRDEYMTYFMNKRELGKTSKGQSNYENVLNYIEAANNNGSNPLNKATFSTEFVRKLLQMYAVKEMTVYDSFMGTGTTAIACIREKMNYVGSELSKAQCDYSEKRIKIVKAQLSLF